MVAPSRTFISRDFKPAWWCPGAHAQTIWAAIQRPLPEFPIQRERWQADDGDFLDVDLVAGDSGRPILVILHGLESSSRAKAVRGFLHAAYRNRWRGVALNFRSCSGELNRNRRIYHAGETSDLDFVIRRLASEHPQSPIFCVGLSLGGNVLLKYLGEQQDKAIVKAAAAISAPFNLAVCAREFEKDLLNRRYMSRLLRSLKAKALGKLKQHPGLFDAQRLSEVRTIREFDDAVTAPMSGFKSAEEYWQVSSCSGFLSRIRRPVLLINSYDDPLVPKRILPGGELAANPFLYTAFTEAGGHMGFIGGRWPSQATSWAEQQALAFLELYNTR